MKYYIKLDPEGQPESLLRADLSRVDVWHQGEWRETVLAQAELDGLGGSSDFYTIDEADVAEWQSTLDG